jgi:hypothetical protein
MGELAGSIINEINPPLAAVVTNAGACLRWLNRNQPDLTEAQNALVRLEQQGQRAARLFVGCEPLRVSPVLRIRRFAATGSSCSRSS